MITFEQEQAIRDVVARVKSAMDDADKFKGDVLLAIDHGDLAVYMKEGDARPPDDMMFVQQLLGAGAELVGILEEYEETDDAR